MTAARYDTTPAAQGARNGTNGDGRSMGELFKELAAGTQTLISQEIRLARLEITQSLSNASLGIGFFVAAGVFGFAGLLLLAFTMVVVLALFLPAWVAALIVTVFFFAIAGIMALLGKSRVSKARPVPEETLQTLKEDQEWLKQKIK